MKNYIWLLGLMLATMVSCNEEEIEEPLTTNSFVSTRFVNSDSISVLGELISGLTENLTSLSESVQAAQSEIDSLTMRISEEPGNALVPSWEESIAKLTATNEQNEATINELTIQNTDFGNKRDSLSEGYSTLKGVTNLRTGISIEMDTLITTYSLPLDFNTTEAQYSIAVDDEVKTFTMSYELEETISVSGKITLTVTNLTVIENDFNSLTIDDEDIYIFHY